MKAFQLTGWLETTNNDTKKSVARFFQDDLPQNIIKLQLDTEQLIIECIKQISSLRIILKGLGNLDLPVRVTVLPSKVGNLALKLDQLVFLKSITGKDLTIREICDLSDRPPWETCQMLYLLMATGCMTNACEKCHCHRVK